MVFEVVREQLLPRRKIAQGHNTNQSARRFSKVAEVLVRDEAKKIGREKPDRQLDRVETDIRLLSGRRMIYVLPQSIRVFEVALQLVFAWGNANPSHIQDLFIREL